MYVIHRIESGDRGAWVAGDELGRHGDDLKAQQLAARLGGGEHYGTVIHDDSDNTYDWGDGVITDSPTLPQPTYAEE